MKIVKESAHLMAYTIGVEYIEMLKDGRWKDLHGNPMDILLEQVGRTAYKSEDKITPESAQKFILGIAKSGHLAVVEHCSATIRLVLDRGISHELVRHRIAAYLQESTRWIKYKDGITVIEPDGLTPFQRDIWMRACEDAERSYALMIESGCKPQMARSVLPTCLKTEVVTTYDIRQWMHVLALRMAKDCHPQMRRTMFMCHDILIGLCPTLFNNEAFWVIRGR
jgi:thymidylate synthase (FAD)